MPQKTLMLAGLAAVAVAIAEAMPMAILALQGSHDMKFEYVKSGGIAGINEKLAFDSKASFDSKTNVITFYLGTSNTTERQLSGAKVQEIREAIAGSGFFAMESIQAKTGPTDYFSYSLTVTMNGMTHCVSWVDDFATSATAPEGLDYVVDEMEQAYACAS